MPSRSTLMFPSATEQASSGVARPFACFAQMSRFPQDRHSPMLI
jgi:hypothetical protein